MSLDYQLIGKRIKKRRDQVGLTQEKLAEACGISEQHISNIERSTSIPSLEVVMRIADTLNTTPDEFLVGTIRREGEEWKNVAELLRPMDEKKLDMARSFLQWLSEQD